nr:SAV2148 family HEPN domain-containing protein [Mangrovactinospora gilvigrisea]
MPVPGDIAPVVLPAEPVEPDPELDWGHADWAEARTRVRRAGRAYVWLNLVEQRLRSVTGAVLRPVYEPVHGAEGWVVAAMGPAGREGVQRAAAVRDVSRRKGYLLDPDDDDLLVFLTLPQLRELIVTHWPCFEPWLGGEGGRRELELLLDELETARHVVNRNRALTENVLERTEQAAQRLLSLLDSGARHAGVQRVPVDVLEEIVGDRYADVIGVHPDRVSLQRDLPAEDLFDGAARLDAMGIALNLLGQSFTGRRLARLAHEGCRLRLLFLNPASSAVRRRERELGLGRGELSRQIETNIMQVRRVRARLEREAHGGADGDGDGAGRVEIRVFDETPRCTAYLVDGHSPDGLAVVQPYLRRARGMESPVLLLRNRDAERGAEHGLFDVYREEFDGCWQDSRPVS